MNVEAYRIPGGRIKVIGVTHYRGRKILGDRVEVGDKGFDCVIVRKPGQWVDGRFVSEDGVAFHGARRSEAAAEAESQSLDGGRVVKVQDIPTWTQEG